MHVEGDFVRNEVKKFGGEWGDGEMRSKVKSYYYWEWFVYLTSSYYMLRNNDMHYSPPTDMEWNSSIWSELCGQYHVRLYDIISPPVTEPSNNNNNNNNISVSFTVLESLLVWWMSIEILSRAEGIICHFAIHEWKGLVTLISPKLPSISSGLKISCFQGFNDEVQYIS